MKKRKRTRKKPFFASRQFVEGKTLYSDEYQLWGKAKIVKSLLGVFEIPFNEYSSRTPEELLALNGHGGLTAISYDTDDPSDEYYQPTSNAEHIAGFTCGVRMPYGNVKPAIFMREAFLPQDLTDVKEASEILAMGKLSILMHEMGHAEDIDRSINFDHQKPSFDEVAGEVYAHRYALTHAQRLGYQHLIFSYCRSLEENLSSENDVYREAANGVCDEFDIAAMKKASGFH